MKNILLSISILSFIILSSCRKDFSTIPSTGKLEFSKDTVFLDTVFTDIGSSTYALKVYNRSKDDITIPTIQLGYGDDSGYRLNVDGVPGKYFEDIDILAKDSIYIFIETTIDYTTVTDPLYVDDLLFDLGSKQQDVKLVTLVQDAHFLFPNKVDGVIETLLLGIDDDGEEIRINGRYLQEDHPNNGNEFIFTNEKPYVIYGYMVVGTPDDQPKLLTVEAGARVHFHANSGLRVGTGSSLHVMGTQNIDGQPETEVVFQGDRLEPDFEDVPGQWGYINILPGSVDNQINYATIKNGMIGIISQGLVADFSSHTLTINNSQFYNNSLFGVLGVHTNIKGENIVVNNSGISAFSAMVGGVYNFTHCTFSNSWSSPRSTPNVWLLDSNEKIKNEDDDIVIADFYETINFTNCIISGSGNIELEFDQIGNLDFNFHFKNNLIQFNDVNNVFDGDPKYDFTDVNYYTGNIFNENPDYKNTQLNELIIGENSACIGLAHPDGILEVPFDILGVSRADSGDIGAYEHTIFEEE